MKKLKVIAAAIVRGALILSPGVAYLWWQWGKVAAMVAILAAIGLEALCCIVIAFAALVIQVWRQQKTDMASEE